MTLSRSIKTLVSRCDASRRRCDRQLANAEQRQRECLAQIEALQQQNRSLRQLIVLGRPQGQLDRAELFLHQRRVAVMRRQLGEFRVEEKKLTQQLETLVAQLLEIRTRRQQWQRQQEKYEQWDRRERQQRRRARLRQEEMEMQELITWKF